MTDLGGNVFVTYAPSGHVPQTMATAGQGAVAEFSENGVLEKTITNNALASPWGVAIAPSSFGKLGGDLLVGNFSFVPGVADMINAFNPVTDAFVGSIEVNPGAGNTAGGLWSIVFGGSGMDGTPNTLFFTDGINGETGGLFGSITAAPASLSAVPEPCNLGHDAGRIWRTRVLGRAAAARVAGNRLTNFGEPPKVGRFLSSSPADVNIFSSGANKCARSGLIAEEERAVRGDRAVLSLVTRAPGETSAEAAAYLKAGRDRARWAGPVIGDRIMSGQTLTRRAAVVACGGFVLVAAMSGGPALAQSRFPVGAIRVDVAPLRANAGDPTATWAEQELPRQLAEAFYGSPDAKRRHPGRAGKLSHFRAEQRRLGLGQH